MYHHYQYHWKHGSHTGITHGYFHSYDVLRNMINHWTGGEWSYWESSDDWIANQCVQMVELPYLKLGWFSDQNHYEFNSTTPRYEYA